MLRIADKVIAFPPIFHRRHSHRYPSHKPHPARLQEGRKELPAPLTYECTTDMQYLRQYFFIREYAYRVDLQLKHFSGQEDEIDKYSHQLVVRKGHFCIGGARLTVSSPDNRVLLPLETEAFRITDMLPELQPVRFCELGRLAILPEYRQQGCLENLFKYAADIARDLGCSYMMGISAPITARRFASVYRQLGYESRICADIATPMKDIHEHLEMQFILVNLIKQKG
jgi:GNAT superfamily N-acetyltransferase